MLLGELQDLARQVAERQVSRPLWLAAVRSALSAAGKFDHRLGLSSETAATLLTGATSVAVPAGKLLSNLLGVFRDLGDGQTLKLDRWRKTDPQLARMPHGQFWFATSSPQTCVEALTWDATELGLITFSKAQTADVSLLLRFQYVPVLDTDEVPEYLLFGALSWIGRTMLQDARAPEWEKTFLADLDGAVAAAITASSVALQIGG